MNFFHKVDWGSIHYVFIYNWGLYHNDGALPCIYQDHSCEVPCNSLLKEKGKEGSVKQQWMMMIIIPDVADCSSAKKKKKKKRRQARVAIRLISLCLKSHDLLNYHYKYYEEGIHRPIGDITMLSSVLCDRIGFHTCCPHWWMNARDSLWYEMVWFSSVKESSTMPWT